MFMSPYLSKMKSSK